MGFAPPPYDGFAFLASAHTDALGGKHFLTNYLKRDKRC